MSDFINDLYNNSPVNANEIKYEVKKEVAMEIKTVVVTDEAPIAYDCAGCHNKYTNYNSSPFCSDRCGDFFDECAPIEEVNRVYKEKFDNAWQFQIGNNQ